jgi:hypothetical protein
VEKISRKKKGEIWPAGRLDNCKANKIFSLVLAHKEKDQAAPRIEKTLI